MTGLENDLKFVLKIVLMIDLKNVLKNSFLFLHFLYIFHILNDNFCLKIGYLYFKKLDRIRL